MNTGKCVARAALVTLCAFLAACGGGGGGGDSSGGGSGTGGTSPSASVVSYPRFAYVADQGGDALSVYRIDAQTGQLRAAGYALAGSTPVAVITDPAGKYVYVANSGSSGANGLSAFAVATDGSLSAITSGSFMTGATPKALTIDPSGKYLYVVNAGNNTISGFSIGAGGTLSALTSAVTGASPTAIAIDPTGKYLYVANNGTTGAGGISAFSINADGSLTDLGAGPATGANPRALAIDPAGKYLYVANAGSAGTNGVSVYAIGAGGALTAVSTGTFTTGANPDALAVDPSGSYLYVANGGANGANGVSPFRINADGSLTAVTTGTFTTGPNPAALAVDPSGKFVYVTCADNSAYAFSIGSGGALAPTTVGSTVRTRETPAGLALVAGTAALSYTPKFAFAGNNTSNNISSYAVDATTGALTALAGSPSVAGGGTIDVTATPNGGFLYAANYNDNTVSAYSIAADGSLGQIDAVSGNSTIDNFAAGTSPETLAVDPAGRFLYTANFNGQNVSGFAINAVSGILTPVPGINFNAGTAPWGVTADPTGRFLYATNYYSGDISAYRINRLNGALTAIDADPSTVAIDNFAAGTKPEGITVDPTGRFAYAVNYGDNTVSAYSIDAATGALTSIAAVSAGNGPSTVKVDATGRFAYVTTTTDNRVQTFAIDPITGALTPIAASPFITGGGPVGLALDLSNRFVYTANSTANTLSGFTRDTAGALSAIDADPATAGMQNFPAGAKPTGITVTGTVQ